MGPLWALTPRNERTEHIMDKTGAVNLSLPPGNNENPPLARGVAIPKDPTVIVALVSTAITVIFTAITVILALNPNISSSTNRV
jgi:hypothetical protein